MPRVFTIQVSLSEVDMQCIHSLCREGAVYAVQYLLNMYPFMRRNDAIIIVKAVKKEMSTQRLKLRERKAA